MDIVKPKKSFGQHFLVDHNIAKKIVNSIQTDLYTPVLEIGAGTGILTRYIIEYRKTVPYVVEIEKDAIAILEKDFKENIYLIKTNFLKLNLYDIFQQPCIIIGNLPYNISSQIFFKILEYRNIVKEVVCMIQKEVAERITSKPNCKSYGILSVLLQNYFNAEYLFTVKPSVFYPKPKVLSGVIRLIHKNNMQIDYDEKLFFQIVKKSFNKRRKLIKNCLEDNLIKKIDHPYMQKRAEQLSPNDFIELTKVLKTYWKD